MSTTFYHAIRVLAKYTSPLLSLIERFSERSVSASTQHPIFIIGSPRSGSTLLYQLLTNNPAVIYINNFINLFHRNLYTGFLLNEWFIKDHKIPHNSFSSDLGNTLKSGWSGPSESGNFWYNWVNKKNDYCKTNNLPENKINGIREVFQKILCRYNKPFVIKNLYNSQRLPLLHQIDPESKIIWIKRDPMYTAQSILLARRKLNIHPLETWSVNPKGLESKLYENEFQLIANQVNLIEKQIEEDLKLFSVKNVMILNYETIKEDVEKIFEFCEIKKKDRNITLKEVNIKNSKKLSTEEWDRLRKELQLLTSR